MGRKYLGDTVDIHAGGIDHVPVHHTNEIAQSEAATGKPLAQIWMHANHILINDQKISKSLGNGITLEDIEGQGFDLETLRLHVLESHYRSQSKFSWESLEAASNRLQDYRAVADLKHQAADQEGLPNEDISGSFEVILQDMTNDLDTPQALATLSARMELIKQNPPSKGQLPEFQNFLDNIDQLLGLKLSQRSDISDEQKQLIAERETARQQQDWAKSDSLRDKLKEQGIGLRDRPERAIWYRL